MYLNYGDVDFFQYGVLVQNRCEHEYDIIYCRPFDDIEDEYYFGMVTVNTTDTWIDKKAVCDFIGMNNEFLELQYAIGCVEYYGLDNFGSDMQGWTYTKQEICEILKHQLIAYDGGFIKQW